MTGGLRIVRPGVVATVQDGGRHGLLRFGVTPAGPMDWISHATANLLAEAPRDAAAIEFGPAGMAVEAIGGPQRVAVAAPGFRVRRQGNPLPSRLALTLAPGEVLEVEPGRSGLWGYIALPGGADVPSVMGSRATHLRSGIGPFGGRALREGDVITAGSAGPGEASDICLIDASDYRPADPPIRFVWGPQDHAFAPEVRALFTSATYRVGVRGDRMAYRLDGPALPAARGHDIVSDGIALGAIQVPGDGQPFVLMADRQPTGGYPKIGTVIRADLPRLAQTRSGRAVRFAPVTVAAAVEELRAAIPEMDRLRPLVRTLRTFRA